MFNPHDKTFVHLTLGILALAAFGIGSIVYFLIKLIF